VVRSAPEAKISYSRPTSVTIIVSSVLAAGQTGEENHAIPLVNQPPGKGQEHRDFDLAHLVKGTFGTRRHWEAPRARPDLLRRGLGYAEDLSPAAEVEVKRLSFQRVYVDETRRSAHRCDDVRTCLSRLSVITWAELSGDLPRLLIQRRSTGGSVCHGSFSPDIRRVPGPGL